MINICHICNEEFTPNKSNRKQKTCSVECRDILIKQFKHTPEAKRKISEALKGNKWNVGKKQTEDTKEKMSKSMIGVHKGKKMSDKQRASYEKYWESLKGKKQSKEQLEKKSASMKGKKMPPRTEEYKKKQSEAKKKLYASGKVPWNKGIIGFNKGRKKSDQERLNISKAQKARATKSHFYIDGRTYSQKNKRTITSQSFEYKQWRRKVFERDGYKCVQCGSGCKLNADHIKQWALYPDLRYEISNGRTLCEECHKKTDTWGHKGAKKVREALKKDK